MFLSFVKKDWLDIACGNTSFKYYLKTLSPVGIIPKSYRTYFIQHIQNVLEGIIFLISRVCTHMARNPF